MREIKPKRNSRQPKWLRRLRLFGLVVGVLAIAAIVLQNWRPVPLEFLGWNLRMPVLVLVALSALLGYVLGRMGKGRA